MSLAQRLQILAAQQPHQLLYEWIEGTSDGDIRTKHSFSYRQTYNRVSALACHLVHKERLLPGDRVLLCYPPGLEFLFAFLGCILANVIPVPSYPPNPRALKATIPIFSKVKNLVGATIVLTDRRYYRWTALKFYASWPPGLKWVATDAIATPPTAPLCEHGYNGRDSDPAFVQFTSGSTGDPKGVIISHRALWESFRGMTACETARLDRSSGESSGGQSLIDPKGRSYGPRFSVMSWLPLYHDLGLVFAALLPIYRAGSASLCSPLDFVAQPLTWLIAISKTRATVSCAPNFAFDLVVKRWQSTPWRRPELDLSSIRFIPVGGETVRAKSLLRFAEMFEPFGFNKKAFCPSYGGAECTVAACAEFSPDLIVSKHNQDLVSCGSSFERSGMLVTVLKRRNRPLDNRISSGFSDLEAAEEAEVGEIFVTGNALSSGYWTGNTPLEQIPQNFVTRDVLAPTLRKLSDLHPSIESSLWFATGDLGSLEEGHLFIRGRVNEAIVVHGRSHVASDIEHTVMTSTPEIRPGCIAAVAATDPNSATEEAFILCETKDLLVNAKAKDVMGNIRRSVGEVHGIAVQVVLLKKGSLPKTTSGKLQRKKAASMWKTGSLRPTAFRAVSEQALERCPFNNGSLRSQPLHRLQHPGPEGPEYSQGPATVAWISAVLSSAIHITTSVVPLSLQRSMELKISKILLVPVVSLFALIITTVLFKSLICSILKIVTLGIDRSVDIVLQPNV